MYYKTKKYRMQICVILKNMDERLQKFVNNEIKKGEYLVKKGDDYLCDELLRTPNSNWNTY